VRSKRITCLNFVNLPRGDKAAHIQTQRQANSKADCRIAAEVCRQIADEMTTTIAQDLDARDGAEALLLVNGFGGTPTIKLYLMYNAARWMLEKRGLRLTRSLVGSRLRRWTWPAARSP
jgi:hypothetical protein